VLCGVWVVCQRYVCVLVCEGVILNLWYGPQLFFVVCVVDVRYVLEMVDMLCACWVCHKCIHSGVVSYLCVCEILLLDNVCDIVIYMYVSIVCDV